MTSTCTVTGEMLYDFIRHRRAPGERLYAVVDAARDRELAFAGRDRLGGESRWLFAHNAGLHMRDVAPYLVPLTFGPRYPFAGSEYLDLWAQRLGNSAGILLMTEADDQRLWEHLRGLFKVADEEGRKFYFRFYDPRVLRSFLNTFSPGDAQEFFGPIRQIMVESSRAESMLLCRFHEGTLQMNEHSLIANRSKSPAFRASR